MYHYFEKLETGYMDVIRDSIENRADDVCKAQEELRTCLLYTSITEGIAEVQASGGERFTVKQLERTRKSLEAKIGRAHV